MLVTQPNVGHIFEMLVTHPNVSHKPSCLENVNVAHVRKVLQRLEPGSISFRASVFSTIHSQPQELPVSILQSWGTNTAQVKLTIEDVTNISNL